MVSVGVITLKRSLVLFVALAVCGCPETTDTQVTADSSEPSIDVPVEPTECKTDPDCLAIINPAECHEARCNEGVCEDVFTAAGIGCESAPADPIVCERAACDGAGACIVDAAFDGAPCGTSNACHQQHRPLRRQRRLHRRRDVRGRGVLGR